MAIENEAPLTVLDWMEAAAARFEAAGLSYGHGTATAFDEAAFLVLRTLGLPLTGLDTSMRKQLSAGESRAVGAIVERRIESRKPAAYLLNEAWIGDRRFYVDERVIVPRSLIGELMRGGLELALPGPETIRTVLDLCTGSGCLAILAALEFTEARIDACDLSQDALEVAKRNVSDYGLDSRIRLVHSDLFGRLEGQTYDLVLSNPPYVRTAEIAAFPAEHRAEPLMAHAGGEDGLDLVRRIIAGAGRHLTAEGVLIVEVGTGGAILEEAYPELPFLWLDTEETSGEVFALPAAALIGQTGSEIAPQEKARR